MVIEIRNTRGERIGRVKTYRPGDPAFPDAIHVCAGTVYGHPESFGQFRSRVHRQLHALAAIDSVFGRVVSVDGQTAVAAPGVTTSLLVAGEYRAEAEDLIDSGPDGEVRDDTLHRFGFRATFYAGVGSAREPASPDGRIRLDFAGMPATAGACSSDMLELPVDSRWTDPSLLRKLLTALVTVRDGNSGCVYRLNFRRRQRDELEDRSDVDWMLYVSRKSVLADMAPGPLREPWLGGELITLTPHLPDPESESDLVAAAGLRSALGDIGLLEWASTVIHGWPPDEAEWRYEELISGAPRGKKYVVNGVDFDGYDASRQVLLYAKRFADLRAGRKEWGLRGMDRGVINEAQRQLRAANKAGGLAIEWHIALQEPAMRAAELLADYANIPPDRIRVFHTPVDNIVVRERRPPDSA